MNLLIKERKDEGFVIEENYVCAYVNNFISFDFDNIIDYFRNYLAEDLITADETFNELKLNISIRGYICDYIVGKIDYETLKRQMENSGLSLLQITILSVPIRKYWRLYNMVKASNEKIDKVIVCCDESNILRALALAKKIKNQPVILDCGDMAKLTFFNAINGVDINEYIDTNISVYFKGYSNSIELYRCISSARCLMREVIETQNFCRQLDERSYTYSDFEEDEEVQYQDDNLFSQDVLTPSLDRFNKNGKTRRLARRNKINILN